MSNTKPVQWDAESEAYLQRYPELRSVLALYGSNGARLHYQNHGKGEGKVWGLQQPAPATATAGPVKTVGTEPLPASYGTDAGSWDTWLKGARQATEGMNQMPGVFSDYGNVPIDDAAARALFYPQTAGQQAGTAAGTPNPQAMQSALAALTGGSAQQPVGSMSPSQQFARILDMGPGAFEASPSQYMDQNGGSVSADDWYFYNKGRDYYAK